MMMERRVRLNHRAKLPLALLAVGVLAGTGDGGASAEDAGGPAKACVADVDKVIATKPTDAMTTAALPADVVAKLDAAARSSFKEAAAPGAIVGVRTPEGTWTAAYGKADPVAGTPMEVGMHTRIGSVTKTFTGTVIMQLAERGKLSLDDPIEKYVPGVPNGDKISLRQLANMTSGVASYTQSTKFTDTYFAKPETIFTPDQLLAVGISASPIFEPGARFDYSNTNPILLGMVIEKVTGAHVGDVFKKMVFDPLGLNHTSWPGESAEMPAPYAQGFTLQGDYAKPDAPSNATNWNPAWGWTAGELISNMADLLTYGRALGTGQGLLSPAAQADRLRSIPGPAGYGIAVGCIDGWVGHTGELPGYNTSVYYDTTSDTTLIVQANSDIASGDCPVSPVLTDDPRDTVCSWPATRILVGLSAALGHTVTPLPQK
jgi:D-alanyl-D-alanine carboxypeptidase